MKKITAVVSAALLVFAFAGCSKKSTSTIQKGVLKVGATPEPHAEILNLVKDDLKAEGIDLTVVEFTDYVTPNDAVDAGDIDANYFQHLPYMESFNKEKGYHTTLCESVIHGEELTWPDKLETDDNGNIKIVEFTDPFPSGGAGRDWEKVTKITLTDEEVYKKQKAIDQFDTQNNGGANFNGNSEFNYAFCKRDEFYWVYVY